MTDVSLLFFGTISVYCVLRLLITVATILWENFNG